MGLCFVVTKKNDVENLRLVGLSCVVYGRSIGNVRFLFEFEVELVVFQGVPTVFFVKKAPPTGWGFC
jgi:hypothetical protein